MVGINKQMSKFTFTGQDGSMGLKKGQTYELDVYSNTIGTIVYVDTPRGEIICPYESIGTFCVNWRPVKRQGLIKLTELGEKVYGDYNVGVYGKSISLLANGRIEIASTSLELEALIKLGLVEIA